MCDTRFASFQYSLTYLELGTEPEGDHSVPVQLTPKVQCRHDQRQHQEIKLQQQTKNLGQSRTTTTTLNIIVVVILATR